jgi:hypothetical protein
MNNPMEMNKIIISLFLFMGLILFVYLAYQLIYKGKDDNEFQKYALSTLFTALGASIAVLLDIQTTTESSSSLSLISDSLVPWINDETTKEIIAISYVLVYLIIGVYTVIKAGKENKYITLLATSFIGILIAVIVKYLF